MSVNDSYHTHHHHHHTQHHRTTHHHRTPPPPPPPHRRSHFGLNPFWLKSSTPRGGLSSAATADHLQVHSCSFTVCTASCLLIMLVIPWRVVQVVSCFSCTVLPFLVRTWSGLAHADGIKSISMPLSVFANALFGALGSCPRFRCFCPCPRVHLRCLRLRRRRRRRPWARRLRSPFYFYKSAGI